MDNEIAVWTELRPKQLRWLGGWTNAGTVSVRFFVGRHEQGAIFAGEAIAFDGGSNASVAPWWQASAYEDAPNRAEAQANSERRVADMFGVTQ